MIVIVYVLFFYSPGDLESTGETTGGVVGKHNRNIVTNDQLNNLRCKRGLVEIIVIVYVLLFYSPGELESTGEKTGDAVSEPHFLNPAVRKPPHPKKIPNRFAVINK
jgi:hypothetical protein